MVRKISLLTVSIFTFLVSGLVLVTPLNGITLSQNIANAETGGIYSDFNGDGFSDLAAGVSGEDFGNYDGGAVNVIYGSSTGLLPAGSDTVPTNQFWSPNSPGMFDGAQGGGFGFALAAGDFNSDGFADLAVGDPSESSHSLIGSWAGSGAVYIIYGTAAGLQANDPDDQFWSVEVPDFEYVSDNSENSFGSVLTVGDFNGDNFDDLAIGAPGEWVAGR